MTRFDACFLTLRAFGVINAFEATTRLCNAISMTVAKLPHMWDMAIWVALAHLVVASILFVFTDKIALRLCRRSRFNDSALSVGLAGTLLVSSAVPTIVEHWIFHVHAFRIGLVSAYFYSPGSALLGIGTVLILAMPILNAEQWKRWARTLDPED